MARKDHGRQVPDSIKGDEDAQAVFGIVEPVPQDAANGGASDDDTADIAQTIVGIIKQHHIVDVWSNEVAQNNMRNAIDDYFFDVVSGPEGNRHSGRTTGRAGTANHGCSQGEVSGMNVETFQLPYGDGQICFRLERGVTERPLAISVNPDAGVEVVAPIDAPLERVFEKVRKRAPWIQTTAALLYAVPATDAGAAIRGWGNPSLSGPPVQAQGRPCTFSSKR